MKKYFPLFTILVLAIIFISACTKIVTTDIGGDLLPPIDGVNTKEMFMNVVSKNWKDTVVKVDIATPNALGYVHDDTFGKTTAAINIELKPSFFPLNLPDSTTIDSVVLVLGYAGVWGDSMSHMKLRVYEIKNTDPGKDVLNQDTVYATNYEVQRGRELTENNVAADIDITKLNDSTHPYNEAAINQLRIRLDSGYGGELLRNYDTSATGAYHNDSLFERTFKGYQVAPDEFGQTSNALLRINLLDTNTKLAIYYKFTNNGIKDTTVSYFKTTNFVTGSSNFVKRDRSGTPIPATLPTPDVNDSVLYVDANPGLYTKITIDSLSLLSNRIVHRAELYMEQVPGDILQDTWFQPPNLFLTPYNTDSMRRFALPYDVAISNGAVANQFAYGCIPYEKKDPVTQQTIHFYTFDISRYVQGIITRKETNYPLILYAPSNDFIYANATSVFTVYTGTSAGPLNVPAIGRVKLGGAAAVAHKMRLRIVYSDIK